MDLGTVAIVVIAIVLVMQYMNPAAPVTTTPTTSGGSVDLCKVVKPSISVKGQNMFLTGTAITTEYARVLERNGVTKDLGQVSTNSGTLNTQANQQYNIYYGENGSTYYTAPELYTQPCQDAAVDKVGSLCTIDSSPTISVKDEYGAVQSASANAQSIATSGEKTVTVRVTVGADKCYGNPAASTWNGATKKKNAICFDFNNTVITSVKSNTPNIAAPKIISDAKVANLGESCYELDLLADNKYVELPITIKAVSSQDPTTSHNITIKINDVDMDLDADSLAEIWDFQDESGNELGYSSATSGTIYIS